MALRHGLLAIGAILVLGLGMYLFFEVHARPAAARAQLRAQAPEAPEPVGGEDEDAPAPAARATAPGAPTGSAGPRRGFAAMIRETPGGAGGTEATESEPAMAQPRLDAIMNEANKAYDRGDYEEAKSIARKVLAITPTSVRMLRIVVSASCIAGDPAEAQAAFVQLPPFDRDQMKTRCGRYGVSFTEP